MIKRGLALSLVLGVGSVALGDAVIHVVPAPSVNPVHPAGTYDPDEVVDVELFLSQDSGAEHLLRLLTLHFDDTYADMGVGALVWEFGAAGHYKDEDGAGGPPGYAAAYVGEGNCSNDGAPCNLAEGCTPPAVCMPNSVFKLGPLPASMLHVPGDGTQVLVATLQVTMPSPEGGPYPLDCMNSDEANPDLCAAFSYGYGCGGTCNALHPDADHPITFLRANTTGLTGGTYAFYVVGEVTPPVCGDGLVEAPEGCDDGGTAPDDGCSATCTVEAGWDCVGEPSVCTEICGDGLIVGVEGCDDTNTNPDDGCSAICTVEDGWECVGEPSVCTEVVCPGPDAALVASDPSNGKLWRSKKNIVRITFDADVTAPAPGQIEIVECISGAPACEEGPDQSGFFDISVENDPVNPRILRLQDTDLDATVGHLKHEAWYKVRNIATWPCVEDFDLRFVVLYGNADGSLFVDNTDLSVISANFGFYFGQDAVVWDINGDMFVDNQDMSIANDNFSGFVPNTCCP
ncbi:MAG: myxococcus cysteine-rich repeat containing protein [Planctomycetota bacterium]|jgi:cysteine-rich repeat protein